MRNRIRVNHCGRAAKRAAAAAGVLITGMVPAFVLQPRARTDPSLSRPYRQREAQHKLLSWLLPKVTNPTAAVPASLWAKGMAPPLHGTQGTVTVRCDTGHARHPSAEAPACRSQRQPGAVGLCRACQSKHRPEGFLGSGVSIQELPPWQSPEGALVGPPGPAPLPASAEQTPQWVPGQNCSPSWWHRPRTGMATSSRE